jgi:chloride channel 7
MFQHRWRRLAELLLLTLLFSVISFVLPLCWQICTGVPPTNTTQERYLAKALINFQCSDGHYNELASLFLTPADTAMQQLFHFRELDNQGHSSLGYVPLMLFFIPYFFFAAYVPGILAPTGLFIPTLVSGAVYGRFVGHLMNYIAPNHVADAGTYALIGAASVLGGMSRMTISGTVILLEACGNTSYLLPLMLTLSVARYVGNKFNDGLYDTQLKTLGYPFLDSELASLGLINYDNVSKIMASPVVTLRDIDSVRNIYDALSATKHNGFPVVKDGKLCGIILRKTLCQLLKLRAFSSYVPTYISADNHLLTEVELHTSATVFFDTLEKDYPNYPTVEELLLTAVDKVDMTPIL